MSALSERASVLPAGVLHIGGDVVSSSSAGEGIHKDPHTGSELKRFAIAGSTEIDRAVEAARSAFPAWKNLPAPQKRALLLAIADKLDSEATQLAAIGALDAGTPITAGMGAFSAIPADWFRYYAGWVDKLDGAVPASYDPDSFWYTRRVPFGVVGMITAYNAPMAFMGLKVAAALAAGNVVVVKPSELAPWAVLRFAEICREVGIPEGVVTILPGGAEAGEALASHAGVDRLSFTGGDQTARAIMALAAQNLTPVSFELGGKSAAVIFDDANLETSVGLAIQGSLAFLSGQACVAGARILVQRGVYETVTEMLAGVASALPVGDPGSEATVIGPIINEHHCKRILGVIDGAAQSDGARLVCGGERVSGELAEGYYIQPTVIADVAADSSLAQNEVFGPVVSVTPFDTETEAIEIANNSRYGLAGYVFTQDLGRAHRVAQSINAGIVTVNSPYGVTPHVPFGGMKSSGFGREGGHEGILEMTHTQSIQINIAEF